MNGMHLLLYQLVKQCGCVLSSFQVVMWGDDDIKHSVVIGSSVVLYG